MCSNKKLLMMDTVVSETCRAAKSKIKFYDFRTDVHLVGFYSILSVFFGLVAYFTESIVSVIRNMH
jgi:hypothetical protein